MLDLFDSGASNFSILFKETDFLYSSVSIMTSINMIKILVFLGILSIILVLAISNVTALKHDNAGDTSGIRSEMVEATMNDSEASANMTSIIKSLNFSCDINLNCFDKKNQVELVILDNDNSTIKIPNTICGDRELATNGLLLIPHVNSSLSLEKIKPFGVLISRGCYIVGNDMISGIYSVRDPVSLEQLFGPKNYSAPDAIILTNKQDLRGTN